MKYTATKSATSQIRKTLGVILCLKGLKLFEIT